MVSIIYDIWLEKTNSSARPFFLFEIFMSTGFRRFLMTDHLQGKKLKSNIS